MSLADSLRQLVINLRCKMCARPSSVETARSSLGADKVERPGEARVEESPFFFDTRWEGEFAFRSRRSAHIPLGFPRTSAMPVLRRAFSIKRP